MVINQIFLKGVNMGFLKFLVLSLLLAIGLNSAEFSKQASGEPQLIQDGEGKEWCPICGMKLPMYYKTNHAAILSDGTKKQYCSIRCLAVDFPAIKDRLQAVQVVAADTEKLIDAKKAFYVIGSEIQGTMTTTSKIAFSTKESALAFQKEFGGELGDFDAAFKSANDSLESDIAMTEEKKKKGVYPKGKKLYELKCKEVDAMGFENINVMKAHMVKNKLCEGLDGEGELQAVSLYLWEVSRFTHKHDSAIDVPEKAKCPVCGMFVAKYPKWAALLEDNGHKHYFDGVKDMLKFYFAPEEFGHEKTENPNIKVTDYYTLEALDAKDAFFVLGSDVLGPMGHEFIPFKDEKSAKEFLEDHKGKRILKFEEIKSSDIP